MDRACVFMHRRTKTQHPFLGSDLANDKTISSAYVVPRNVN
jgi:hypothetical protein